MNDKFYVGQYVLAPMMKIGRITNVATSTCDVDVVFGGIETFAADTLHYEWKCGRCGRIYPLFDAEGHYLRPWMRRFAYGQDCECEDCIEEQWTAPLPQIS